MDSGLREKVVVITGASGGIGSGIVRAFAAEGAKLVLHYRSGRNRILTLQRELKGVKILVIRGDLRREADCKRLFRQAQEHFGQIDTLIANAGAWETRDTPFQKMQLSQWQCTLDGVLTTTFLALREFLRLVAKQRRGNAILIASTAAVFGEAGHADYAAGKAAIAYGLTKSLKNEIAQLAPHTSTYCGGRINCICPGWTVVPRLAKKLANPAMVRKALSSMALPQLARPHDIANAAVYLASDKLARHITGQILVVAGGMEGRILWNPDELDLGSA